MAIVLNWHRIRKHFVLPLAWQIDDEQHIAVFRMHHFPLTISVNEHDAIIIQNIRQHHQDILMGSDVRPTVHWPMHVLMVQGIMLVLSSFGVVEIIPESRKKKLLILLYPSKYSLLYALK